MVEAGCDGFVLVETVGGSTQYLREPLVIEARSRLVCSLASGGRPLNKSQMIDQSWLAVVSVNGSPNIPLSAACEASERLLCIGHIQVGLAERLRKSFVIEGSVRSFGAGRIQV